MAKAFKLNDEKIFITTESPAGFYNEQQLDGLAHLCKEHGLVLKATEDQRLAMVIAEDKIDDVRKVLSDLGLGMRPYQAGVHQPVSCIGALCPQHDQDAQKAAIEISQALDDIDSQHCLKIGINGCALCCVPCHTYDISLVGDEQGYKMSIGGKNSLIPEMAQFVAEGIPADKLTELVKKVAELYLNEAEEDEALYEVIDRVGLSRFIDVLSPYSQDASSEHDNDPFGALDEEVHKDEDQVDEIPCADDLTELAAEDDSLLSEEHQDSFSRLEQDHLDEQEEGELMRPSNEGEAMGLEEDLTLEGEQEINNFSEDVDISPADLKDDAQLDEEVPIDTTVDDQTATLVEDEDQSFAIAEQPYEDSNHTQTNAEEHTSLSDENAELDEDDIDDEPIMNFEEIKEETFEQSDQLLDYNTEDDSLTDEEEETELEQKIEASIAEQSALQDQRNEARQMEQEREAAFDAIQQVPLEENTEDLSSYDNNSDEDEDLDDIAMESFNDAQDLHIDLADEMDEIDDELPNNYENDQLSEGEHQIPSSNTNEAFSTATAAQPLGGFNGLSFSQGKIHCLFNNGANVTLDIEHLRRSGGRREINLAGATIRIAMASSGVAIEVDGVEAFFPFQEPHAA